MANIQADLDAITKAGGGKEDQLNYLRMKGLITEEANAPENSAISNEKKTPLFSTPGIEANLQRREQPSRLEQALAQILPELVKADQGKGTSAYALQRQASPFPSAMRTAGRLGDIPIDLIQGLAQMAKQNIQGTAPNPQTQLMGMGKEILTNLGTTARHPFKSFKGSPIETASDVYLGLQGLKAATKGIGAITKGISDTTKIGKDSPLAIGRAAEKQLLDLRSKYGEALGEQKDILRSMNGNVDTREIIKSTLENIERQGPKTFEPSELKELKTTLNDLGLPSRFSITNPKEINSAIKWVDSHQVVGVSPTEAIQTRDMISQRFLPTPKPGHVRIAQGTSYGDSLKVGIKEGLEEQMIALDTSPEFGGTGGKWIAFNNKYKNLMDTFKQVMPKLDTVTAEDYMEKIGKEILGGHEGYTELWGKVDKLTGGNTTSRLSDYAQWQRGLNTLKGTKVLGTNLNLLTGLKDLGVVGTHRLGGTLGGMIEGIPTNKLGLNAAMLQELISTVKQ